MNGQDEDCQNAVSMNLEVCMRKGTGADGTGWSNGALARELKVDRSLVGHWRTGNRSVTKKYAVSLFRTLAEGSHGDWYIEHLKPFGRALEETVEDLDNEPLRQAMLETLNVCSAPPDWVGRERKRMKLDTPAEVFWAASELSICGPAADKPAPPSYEKERSRWIIPSVLAAIAMVGALSFHFATHDTEQRTSSELPKPKIGSTVLAPWGGGDCLYEAIVISIEDKHAQLSYEFGDTQLVARELVRVKGPAPQNLGAAAYLFSESHDAWLPVTLEAKKDRQLQVVLGDISECNLEVEYQRTWATLDQVVSASVLGATK